MAKITTVNYDKEKEKLDEVASRTYGGGTGVGSQSNIEKLARDYVDSNYDSFTKGNDYASLAKRYSDQGRRAMDDTMGQVAARTGGLASSYAASAGQQAYGDWMGKLEDAARGLYDSQQAERLSKLGVAQGMQDRDFEKWSAQRDFDLTAANNNVTHAQYMDSVADNNREQALSDYSNDVYMDMYLMDPEKLSTLTFDEYSKGKTDIPEGFDERDFEMVRRQVQEGWAETEDTTGYEPEYTANDLIGYINAYQNDGGFLNSQMLRDYEAINGEKYFASLIDKAIVNGLDFEWYAENWLRVDPGDMLDYIAESELAGTNTELVDWWHEWCEKKALATSEDGPGTESEYFERTGEYVGNWADDRVTDVRNWVNGWWPW